MGVLSSHILSGYPSPLSFEQHMQRRKQHCEAEGLCQCITSWLKWSKRWPVCLLKWSTLSICSSHIIRKAPFWVQEWAAFALTHYEPDKKEQEWAITFCPMKNLILPILHYCLSFIIDQGRAIKRKTLCKSETKAFNFSLATYLEQTLRIKQ